MTGYDARFWELPFDPGNFGALPGELFDTPAHPSGGEERARAQCSYPGRAHGKLVQKGGERCQQRSGCRGKLPASSSGAACLRSWWTARTLVRLNTVRPSRFRSSQDITLLRIRAGRYSSRDHSFDLADNDAIDFRCSGAIFWPRWVLSLFKPDLGVLLKRG
jgi:hypothetical protein